MVQQASLAFGTGLSHTRAEGSGVPCGCFSRLTLSVEAGKGHPARHSACRCRTPRSGSAQPAPRSHHRSGRPAGARSPVADVPLAPPPAACACPHASCPQPGRILLAFKTAHAGSIKALLKAAASDIAAYNTVLQKL